MPAKYFMISNRILQDTMAAHFAALDDGGERSRLLAGPRYLTREERQRSEREQGRPEIALPLNGDDGPLMPLSHSSKPCDSIPQKLCPSTPGAPYI